MLVLQVWKFFDSIQFVYMHCCKQRQYNERKGRSSISLLCHWIMDREVENIPKVFRIYHVDIVVSLHNEALYLDYYIWYHQKFAILFN